MPVGPAALPEARCSLDTHQKGKGSKGARSGEALTEVADATGPGRAGGVRGVPTDQREWANRPRVSAPRSSAARST